MDDGASEEPSANWRAGRKEDRLDAGALFEAWSAATLATQPVGAKQTPPVVRTPTGPVQDTQEYFFAGKPLWEPSEIKAPTLIVVGEWDGLLQVSQAVFDRLTNTAYKRLVQIGQGTTWFSWRRIASIFSAKSSYFLMSHVRQARCNGPQ